jgi:uncharacterized protein (TIGR00661 family)
LNGGYTTICEALVFQKPVLCLPIQNQIEQELNAAHLRRLGYGDSFFMRENDVPDLNPFLSSLDTYTANIKSAGITGNNDALFERVDTYLNELKESM